MKSILRLLLYAAIGLVFCLNTMAQQNPNELALERIRASQQSGRSSLSLAGLGITEVPPEIGNLINLQTLWLNHNDLTTLPPEIGNLVNLESLILNHNQLRSLPPEIGNLANLQELDLAYNELKVLPASIGNLSTLNQAYWSNNELSSLPPDIGKLSNLRWLDVSNNQLSSLPEELGEVALEHINVAGNLSPLAQMANQDTQAILNYAANPVLVQFWPLGIVGIAVLVLSLVGLYYFQKQKKQPKRRRIKNRAT
jgi:Leucine-rich repeat (LRR) protein